MICHICHTDKALCLFTPKRAASKHPKCRQCVSDENKRYVGNGGKDAGMKTWKRTMKVHFKEGQ